MFFNNFKKKKNAKIRDIAKWKKLVTFKKNMKKSRHIFFKIINFFLLVTFIIILFFISIFSLASYERIREEINDSVVLYFLKKITGFFIVVLVLIAIEALIFMPFTVDKKNKNKYLIINFIILITLSALFIYLDIIEFWHYFE